MGTMNIYNTSGANKASLTFTGSSDKTIDANAVLQSTDSTASIANGKVVVGSSGRVLVGTSTDDGSNTLQVNGNISSNGDKRVAAITVSTSNVTLASNLNSNAVGWMAFISYWNTSSGAQGVSIVTGCANGVYTDINHDSSGCTVSFSGSTWANLVMKTTTGTVQATARIIQ